MDESSELYAKMTPAQRAECREAVRDLRASGGIATFLGFTGLGAVMVWNNGTVSRDRFAPRSGGQS